MGTQQYTQRFVTEHLAAKVKDSRQVALQLPDLAFTAAAKRGRIQHDSIILVATAHFTGEKFRHVFYYPADVRREQIRELGVVSRPGNDTFRRIQMHHTRPGCRGCQRHPTSVGKGVEETYGPSGILHVLT